MFSLLYRYITILYYLNDVEEEGETVFPVADMKNFNETLSAACHDSLLTSTNVQILTL